MPSFIELMESLSNSTLDYDIFCGFGDHYVIFSHALFLLTWICVALI